MDDDGRSSRPPAGAAGCLRRIRLKKRRSFTARPVRRTVDLSDRCAGLGLEPDFWKGLDEICAREGKLLGELLSIIGERCARGALSASIRVFVVSYFRAAAPDAAGEAGEASYPLRVAFGAVG